MGSIAIIDTNVAIYLLSGKLQDAIPEGRIAASVITEIELLVGITKEDSQGLEAVRRLLRSINIIPVDDLVKEAAVSIRREHRLKLPDAIVAATALVLGGTLWTNDSAMSVVTGLEIHRPSVTL